MIIFIKVFSTENDCINTVEIEFFVKKRIFITFFEKT